jgi:lipoprotein-releasing system permease protein
MTFDIKVNLCIFVFQKKSELNLEFFISRRISSSKENKSLSSVFIRIAIIASALSLIVMILSVSILDGFKDAIKDKLAGFGANIIVSKHDSNYSFETSPVQKNMNTIKELRNIPGVKHVQCFAVKAGLIKTNTETIGVILKGVGDDYDWSFLNENMVRGKHFMPSKGYKTCKDIVISEELARLADVDTGQYIYMYFIEEQTRMRKYRVVGIYNSGMSEFDKLYIFADIHDVEKLNNWHYYKNEQISGYEITIKDFSKLSQIERQVNRITGFRFDKNGEKLKVTTIKQMYPQIFDWLSLLDMNALILIIIMIIIASINMITALLILILERTRMIGVLKSLGAHNASIRKIFIYNGIFILLKGLLWGNIIALGLAFVQKYTHFIPLNPKIYYMNYVPFDINFLKILFINIGMIVITFFILIIPSMIISKIEPVKAIRFE